MPQHEPLPIVWQKRVFDLFVSSILLVITSPIFILFFILLFIEHSLRGRPLDPLLYSEQRISRGMRFKIYKFNIFDQRIINELRARGQFIHTKQLEWDGKLVFVGKLLKQIYMDELPQLFNVIKGEMSLVGPRPLNREVFANANKTGVPAISVLQGGMTGNYQSYKNTRGLSATELDAKYIKQYSEKGGWSIVLKDIIIILRTFIVLLRAKGV